MDPNKKRVSFSQIDIEVLPDKRHMDDIDEDCKSRQESTSSSWNMSMNNQYLQSVDSRYNAKFDLELYENFDNGEDSTQQEMGKPFDPKFFETRRRSHAFSVSAIDETLQMCEDNCWKNSIVDTADGVLPDHIKKQLQRMHSDQSQVYRHAEIPITNEAEMLITHTKREIVSSKSFNGEIRTIRDMEAFFENPYVILDMECNSTEEIILKMLEKVFDMTF